MTHISAYKEYISVIEGTAPPSSSKHLTLPTSLRSVCSILHCALPARLTEQAERGWESQMFGRRMGVLSLLSLIYIFFDIQLTVVPNVCAHAVGPPLGRGQVLTLKLLIHGECFKIYQEYNIYIYILF